MKKVLIISILFIAIMGISILGGTYVEATSSGTIDFMALCKLSEKSVSDGNTRIYITGGTTQIDGQMKHNDNTDTIVTKTFDIGNVVKGNMVEFFFYTEDEDIAYGTQFLTVTDNLGNTICKIDKKNGNNKNNIRIAENNGGVIINPSYFELNWDNHSTLTSVPENKGYTYTFKEKQSTFSDHGSIRNYNLLETNSCRIC